MAHSKQFEVLRKYPAKSYWHNKSLMATRGKLVSEVLDNMEEWLSTRSEGSVYKRRKNYGLNYGPMKVHEISMPREHVSFMETLAKLAAK